MKITVGFSTCPNDTYIFDALVNGKIENRGIEFIPVLEDVEELNSRALEGDLDVSKMSYFAYGHVSGLYKVLDAGSALGWGNGPLMVSRRKIYADEVSGAKIAVPGMLTTANFLTGLAFPEAGNKKAYLFSDIEDVVLSDEADIGVLIHETRFTYRERGLKLIMDLGDYWEKNTKMPIPLGGIMVHRRIPREVQVEIQDLIRESIEFAMNNPGSAMEYMKRYSRELKEDIIFKHVDTFVNNNSLSLGEDGRNAVLKLLELGSSLKLFPAPVEEAFVPSKQ